jgi:hypothetical protein
MTRTITLAEQRVALTALAQLSAAFGHLPGAHFSLNTIFPQQVDISLHEGLDAFEVWREALGIASEDVQIRDGKSSAHLKAVTQFAGATVELIGYTDPLPAKAAA